MQLLEMRKALNSLLAGEMLSMELCKQHINYAINEINVTLNSCFPILTDVSDLAVNYDCIPDKYISMVVLPGAAHHYYMVDDEGTTAERDFGMQFEQGKFYMLRDYSCMVPAEYQCDNLDIGSVQSTYEDYKGTRGVFLRERPRWHCDELTGGYPLW